MVHLVNCWPRLGKLIQDENIWDEWLCEGFEPSLQDADYMKYFRQIIISLSLVFPSLNEHGHQNTPFPIIVQHNNLPIIQTE
jgi:hypothetical protein